MKIMLILCVLMIAMPAFAGTFKDNFDDGNFDGWTKTRGNWELREGHAFCANNDISANLLDIGNTWEAKTIECDVRIVSEFQGLNYRYIGINSKVLAFGTGLSILLSRTWNGFQGYHALGGFNFDFKQHVLVAKEIEFNRWYHLKSIVEGNHYRFLVDNEVMPEFDDDTFPTGAVGLIIGGLTGEFDNVVITGDKVPDVGPSGYAVNSKGKFTTTWGEIRRGK